ncbi:LOW QUALITY PROTEIN: protein canopy homolog 4 [Alligator mississippiensis]|uniref:LOW QUALITY PROTEIN: protein canopy homolog 4 n=1 Tax=Alligator mississippiensis TaxID=8496 RepID=UPI00287808D6|nr:LOW QUALITY PROTEIN: protein canopy homolog 4 [Alligator mississippiensis]
MSTLRNLVHKGVKVDRGVPPELWDEPSVEVTQLKQQVRPSGGLWVGSGGPGRAGGAGAVGQEWRPREGGSYSFCEPPLQCEVMLECYEEPLEDWYFQHQKRLLRKFLCEGHVPGARDVACLDEVWTRSKGDHGNQEEEEDTDAARSMTPASSEKTQVSPAKTPGKLFIPRRRPFIGCFQNGSPHYVKAAISKMAAPSAGYRGGAPIGHFRGG